MSKEIQMSKEQFRRFVKTLKHGIANDIVNALVRRVPVDTGNLRNSITYRVDGKDIEIHMADYGRYVEFGTAPHIIKPVNKKALSFKVDGNKVLTKEVHHPGTRPQPFIRPTLRVDLPNIIQDNMRRHAV